MASLSVAEGSPPGHAWRWVSSIDVRQGDHPAIPVPLPGMLEGRVTLLAGAGGSGKTTLTEQIVRHCSNGARLGKFDVPEKLLISWCIYLEDVEVMAQDRSLRAAKFGSLEEDKHTTRDKSPVRYLFGRDFRISDLEIELELAQLQGVGPQLVVIDHLRILIGSQPAGTSPNDWERKNLLRLIDLADRFDLHFIVLTHLNKAGKVSGTTELINSVDTAYVIEPSIENREFATLVCHKMRMSPERDYALMKKANGTWGFTDEVYVSETLALGIARDILRVLREYGPQTLSELLMHPAIDGQREAVRKALYRAKQRGWVRPYRGHWEIIPGAGDELLATPEPEAPAPEPAPPAMPPKREEQPAAAVPQQRPAPVDPAPWDPEPIPEDEDEFKGLAVLKESIKRSRMHPMPFVPTDHRSEPPWTLITERMAGAPKWLAPGWSTRRVREEGPDGTERAVQQMVPPWIPGSVPGELLLIDRNGSFPSACSSVRIAPNKLVWRGPQERYDTAFAGIYQIRLPEWLYPDRPHPLGRIAERLQPGELVWITTSHMALLEKLADGNRIKRVAILDSWLGRANGSLFEHFYKEARAARAELAPIGGDRYAEYKRSVSTALRLLWPKEARSPFWRPDWSVTMRAEAAVRHWVKADEAISAGATLVALGNTDAAVFWSEDGNPPESYRVGLGFGEVKVRKVGS